MIGLHLIMLLGCLAMLDTPGGAPALRALAQQNPRAFLEECLQQGPPRLADYRCRFVTNERIGGTLTGEQIKKVHYRRSPRSVYMEWLANPGKAQRVAWIQGRDRTSDGREQLRVEPRGLAGLFVSDVLLPMDDDRVSSASLRPITEFGPDATLGRIVRENLAAFEQGVLDLRYDRESIIDGRPSFVFVRRLPYRPGGPYPDALMLLHIDQEWLVPLAIHSYADPEAKNLLESYEFTALQPNVGLTDADFQF